MSPLDSHGCLSLMNEGFGVALVLLFLSLGVGVGSGVGGAIDK